MPFNGSGGFQRLRRWQDDASGGIKIRSDYHDSEDDNLASGLSSVITKDGQTQPVANLPLNGKRWVNSADPEDPQDLATKHYCDTLPGWTTSKNISGADADGRLNFTSPTGVNGIGWTAADLSWLAKVAEASKTSHRLVMNTAGNGSGVDAVILDEGGRLNLINGQLTQNLSYDGAAWRTIVPGLATMMQLTSAQLHLSGNDVATTTDPYKLVTLRDFYSVQNQGGSIVEEFHKSASGKYVAFRSYTGTSLRWQLQFGDGTAESGRNGSDFVLTGYDNGGAPVNELHIDRSTHVFTIGGDFVTPGKITFDSIIQSSDTAAILAAALGGSCYLRPNGNASAAGEVRVDSTGDAHTSADLFVGTDTGQLGGTMAGKGIRERPGATAGAYGTEFINFNYATNLHAWRDNTDIGQITITCDYRLKQDIAPLPSVWDKVKALRPVSFRRRDFDIGGVFFSRDSQEVEWGFVAHQLQEDLLFSAASAAKDAPHALQGPNVMAILAALARALQEAQERIEALEAAA